MRRLVGYIALLIGLLAPADAFGQASLLQGGGYTAGRAPMYAGQGGAGTQPIVIDSGPAGGGGPGQGLAELLLTMRGPGSPPYSGTGSGPFGTNACDFDAPITSAGGYHYLCWSPNAQGGGLIVYGAAGGAPTLPFTFNLNGVSYPFPFVVGGIVGPNTTILGDAACWNNTNGTLLKDCGLFVAGPNTTTLGDAACWNNTTGTLVKDCGTFVAAVPTNAALKAIATAGLTSGSSLAYRGGFAAAGDGGNATYLYSSSACTLGAGAGDNGMQVKPNSGAGCWTAVPQAQWNVLMWGAVCSDSIDSSTAFLNAITAVFALNPQGGSIFFPCSITVNSAVAITFTGSNPPVQPHLRLVGSTVWWGTGLTGIQTPGGSGLNLLYTGLDGQHIAKITTFGEGILEFDHMVIKDTGTDNYLMIYSTNTRIVSNTSHYVGNPTCVAPACSQDIFTFGGIGTATGTSDPTATFQGYLLSSINDSFSFCRHVANYNGNANAISFINFTVDYTCGSTETFGAAFVLVGAGATSDANIWLGGIVEMLHYPYGFIFSENTPSTHNSSQNQVIGTYVGDPGGSTVAIAYVSANSCGNLIAPSLSNSPLLAGPGVACNTGMGYNAASGGWSIGSNVPVVFGYAAVTFGLGTAKSSSIFNGDATGVVFSFRNNGTVVGGFGTEIGVLGSGSTTKFAMSGSGYRLLGLGAGTVTSDANGNLSVTSDERLKHVKGDFTKGILTLLGIDPIVYSWAEGTEMETEGTYVGFGARQVRSVLPEAVGENARGDLTLSDRALLANTINSVKQIFWLAMASIAMTLCLLVLAMRRRRTAVG